MKLIIIILLTLLPLSLNAQHASSNIAFDEVSNAIYEARKDYAASGSYITVTQNGTHVYTSVNGMADVEHQVPVSTETVFDLASIAKMFTGYAIAELAQENVLSVDDDIRSYLVDFPDYGYSITIGDLVHHTSGIKNWTTLLRRMNWPYGDRISYDQILRMAHAQSELDFIPGTQYQYSNTGYVLLVAIIEQVTGEPFVDWTKENIFDPLGMKNTFFNDNSTRLIPHLAGGYFRNGSGEQAKDMNNTTALGSSSLISNGSDMNKWMNFLMHPPKDKKSIIERMLTTKMLKDGSQNNYAYGIIVEEYKGTKFIHHSGSWASHTTHLVLLPDVNTSIFLAHNFRTNTRRVINMYVDALLAEDIKTPIQNSSTIQEKAVVLSSEQLDKFLGTYQLGEAWFVTISKIGEQLYATANGERTVIMNAIGEKAFRVRAYGNRTIEFQVDKKGAVNSLIYNEKQSPKINTVDAEQLTEYADFEGVYYNVELELMFKFEVGSDALYAKSIKHGNLKLVYIDTDDFMGEGVIRSLTFTRDEDRQVTGFDITNWKGEKATSFVKAERF